MRQDDHPEEKFYGNKGRKSERKIASKTDRSKFKKTDLAKRARKLDLETEKRTLRQDLLEGRVLSVLPQEICVDCNGTLHLCTLKGKLKKERMLVKNLVVVGDFVFFEKTGAIVEIEKRRSLLSRRGSHHTHKEQIVASNIDLVLITASCESPLLDPSVIDRFIIASQKGGMEPVIVINKVDLMKNEELYQQCVATYQSLGLKVISVSALKNIGLDELKETMKNKASLFAGASGVGKSSLINAMTGLQLLTRQVTQKTQKGVHTTVGAKLIPLEFGGWCIDSPGIQSFGLWDLQRSDLEHFFPEIFEIGTDCRYQDCTHVHEPKCAVLEALHEGKISPLRYNSYKKLWNELAK